MGIRSDAIYPPFTAEFYDHITLYRDREDVAFYRDLALERGGEVLELGCGTGRVLLPLARSGVTITGLDSTPAMLEVCERRLTEEPASVREMVTLTGGDMRDFDLGRDRFSLVTVPFRGFQHLLTTEDQIACLGCVRWHLARDGVFVLDIFNPSLDRLVGSKFTEESEPEPEFEMPDGRRVYRTSRNPSVDVHSQCIEAELIYYVTHPDGRTERLVDNFTLRYLFRFEAEHLLARCGFEVLDLYSGFDKSPYGTRYPGELIFLARKK